MYHLALLASFLFILACNGNSQKLSKEELHFLHNNVKTVCTGNSLTNCNWNTVSEFLGNKKIILIGEPNHGSREIFLARNNLISYLHEEHGYNTILFESGIGEMIYADLNKTQLTPEQMTYGFFGGWRTSEFRNLMQYIKSAGMSVAGFDVQRTGGSFKNLVKKLETNIDTAFFVQLEDNYGIIQSELSNRSAVYDSVVSKTGKLLKDYTEIYNISVAKDKTSNEILLLQRTLLNRIEYLQYMLRFVKDKDWHKRWTARDAMMAQNIEWLLENIYKNEKIIVAAHNFHIAKYNKNEKVMGKMLSNNYDNEMYSIGSFAGKGVYANNSGKKTNILPADSLNLDIKHIIANLTGFINFLDIPAQQNPDSQWLYNDIIANDTFIDLNNTNKMILAKHFDGLLFVQKVSLPEK